MTFNPTPIGLEEVSYATSGGSDSKSSLSTSVQAGRSFWRSLAPFLALIRFYLHKNYAVVLIGSLFFEGPAIPAAERALDLLKMYVSFAVCLYGGIYTMNAVTDAAEDREHPTKCARPVPSGAVSEPAAILWSLSLIGGGYALSYVWYGVRYFPIFSAFLAINVAYSLVFRNVRYSRFFTAALTSPCRLALGSMMARATISAECFVMAYLFMVGAHSSKIRAEYNLRATSADGFKPGALEAATFSATAACIGMNLLGEQPNPLFCAAVVASNLFFVVGCACSNTVARFMYPEATVGKAAGPKGAKAE